MWKPFGMLLLLVAATGAGAGTSAVIVRPSPLHSSAAAAACAPAQIAVSLGDDAAGAGERAFVVVFHNRRASSCRAFGSAGIEGVTRHGSTVPALRSPQGHFTFKPHGVASAVVHTDVVQANGETCVTYAAVLVEPPGITQWTRLRLRWKAPSQGPLTAGLTHACVPLSIGRLEAGIVSPA